MLVDYLLDPLQCRLLGRECPSFGEGRPGLLTIGGFNVRHHAIRETVNLRIKARGIEIPLAVDLPRGIVHKHYGGPFIAYAHDHGGQFDDNVFPAGIEEGKRDLFKQRRYMRQGIEMLFLEISSGCKRRILLVQFRYYALELGFVVASAEEQAPRAVR